MSDGKLRYRTTAGWTLEVDADAPLTRLPLGCVLLDLELVFTDASAPRQRREARVISLTRIPGKKTVAVLD